MKNWQSSELLSSKVKCYFSPQHTHRFWCGWDRPTGQDTQAGKGASADTVLGHLGYTGTALWWDPALNLGGTLLTNRIYPSHQEASMEEIRYLRVKFFSLLWQNNRRELWKTLADQKSWT
jgi:CubicO group peptidase (beta-lactamase class C family)